MTKQKQKSFGSEEGWRYLSPLGDLLRIVVNKNAESDRMGRITVNQARIFGYVFDHGEETIRLKTLAHDLDVSPAAASQAVDRLVNAGLVDRETDPEDRRAVSIRLSKQGTELIARFGARTRDVLAEALSDVSAQDRETFFRVAATLHGALTEKWFSILAEKDALKTKTQNP